MRRKIVPEKELFQFGTACFGPLNGLLSLKPLMNPTQQLKGHQFVLILGLPSNELGPTLHIAIATVAPPSSVLIYRSKELIGHGLIGAYFPFLGNKLANHHLSTEGRLFSQQGNKVAANDGRLRLSDGDT